MPQTRGQNQAPPTAPQVNSTATTAGSLVGNDQLRAIPPESPPVPLISGKQESRHDNLQSDSGASDRNSRVAASAIAASSPLSYATEVPRNRHWRSLSKFPGTQISNVRRNPPSFIVARPVITTLQGRCSRGASARSYAGRFSSMSERTSASAMSAITRALTIGRGDVTSSG